MAAADQSAYENNFNYYESDDAARAAETDIVAGLEPETLFEDPHFAADGDSLYTDPSQPPRGALPPSAVEWNRINQGEITDCEEPVTFAGGTSSGDVIQGALGDCWFISAMSVLAARPALVEQCVVSEANKDRGIYTLKFYKGGRAVYVHIDDRIPCNRSGKVLYAKCKDANEMWVPLLEKAYAKLHGNYQRLISGYIDFGLRDLTGTATMKLKFKNKKVAKMIAQDGLWPWLLEQHAEGSLMGCSMAGGTEHDTGNGILSGHAYGILDLREVSAPATEDVDEFAGRMVRVRNPWGMREWKGDWCDNDVFWEDYPSIKNELNPGEFVNDGTFWMTFDDFLLEFSQIFAALDFKPEWSAMRFRGQWVPGDNKSGAGGMPKFPSFPQNPQYVFTVSEPTTIMTVLSQKDNRWQGGPAKYATAVGFVIMRLSEGKRRSNKFHPQKMAGMSRTFAPCRSIAGLNKLEPGRYAIIPCTYKPGTAEELFILENYASSDITYDQEGDELPDLDEMEADSDDDALGPYELGSDMEEDSEEEEEPEDDGIELKALQDHVGELAALIRGLRTDVSGLEARVASLTAEEEG